MRIKGWIAVLIVLALVATGVWAWRRAGPRQAGGPAPDWILGTVSRTDLRVTVTGTGTVRAGVKRQGAAEVAGTVAELLVADGDRVAADEPVLRLSNPQLQDQLQQAELDLAQAELKLREITDASESAVAGARLKVEQARLTLANRAADAAHLEVRAPVAGVVTGVTVLPGNQVGNNTVLLSLYDQQAVRVEVGVPQPVAAGLRPGQAATVTLAGLYSGAGVVAEIAAGDRVDAARGTVPVTITLPAVAGARPGLAAAATLVVPGAEAGGTVRAGGTVVPWTRVAVPAQASGRVQEIHVRDGQQVAAGAPLVTLDNPTLLNQVEQARRDLEAAEANLRNLLEPLADSSNRNSLQNLQLQLAKSRLTLESRRRDVAHLTVRAPVAGTVSDLPETGDRVTAGAPLFAATDYDNLEVVIAVDELDLPKITSGSMVDVRFDALPDQHVRGRITAIAGEGKVSDGVAKFDLTVRLAAAQVRPGMTAEVQIPVASREGALAVPAQAVQRLGDASLVRVVRPDGSAESVPVTVGLDAGTQVEIVSGLQEGDRIVVSILQQQNLPFGPPGGGFRPPGGGIGPGGGGTSGGGGR